MIENPERIYPCDCEGEGLVVHQFECLDEWSDPTTIVATRDTEMEDECNYNTVGISFWGFGPYTDGRLSWWNRIRAAYHILKKGHPYHDMVALNIGVARSFANRILYLANKMEAKQKMKPYEVLKLDPEPKNPNDHSKMTDKQPG